MSEQKGLSWVQQLNKEQIKEELIKRCIAFVETDKFENLRELLRETVRKEIAEERARTSNINNNPIDEGKVDLNKSTSSKAVYSQAENEAESDPEDNMANEGIRLEFCLHKDNWENFVERLELYFIAKDIKAEKQAAHLLTRLDEEAFGLMKQLVQPDRLNSKTFDDLVKTMTEHLNPKPSEIMERCKFNVAKQEPSESVAEFAARLKKLSSQCNFSDIRVALRDQFVSGLRNHDTKAALFRIDKLDFETAFKEAVCREAAEKNATNTLKVLENKNGKSEIYAFQNSRKPKNWNNRKGSAKLSEASSKQQHTKQPGDSKNVVCYCCGKPNHTNRQCTGCPRQSVAPWYLMNY